MRLSLGIALVVSVLGVTACDFGVAQPNNSPCTKNDDCESKHCIASVCRAAPQFGGASAGAAGTGAAGSSGGGGSAAAGASGSGGAGGN